ncbi:MAG: RNA 2',3'-cyclic phosphodiesterase [Candidatus Marinimicrobia bacterium]|nr:RNA 2',3'-cyclic phosphodiesterase [Candidatus Neomarinimicrobiota bacterium]
MERIFFAIPLSDEIKDVLDDVNREMQEYPGKLKWVDPSSTHLTLKFVGEVEKSKSAFYSDAIRELDLPDPFTIQLNKTGVFPHPRKPRVLWVGIEQSDDLTSLANIIDDRLAREDVEPETRDFHPHLTVARVKGRGLPGETLDTFLNLDIPDISMEVDSVLCYKSDLRPGGAVYTALETISL